jgi:GDP-4-dehydro-6-deoxy-D-mannose reductase
MDTALILSGNSFIGRHLHARLRAAHIPCQATSRTGQAGKPGCDLTRPEQVDQLLQALRPRWIFQCAGATAHADSLTLHRLHHDATRTLLEAVRRHVPQSVVVLFGSAAEYGPVSPDRLPIAEDVPPCPQSPYGQSKLRQTQLAERLTRLHRLRVHLVRPFNVLGPGLGRHYFAAAFRERLRQLSAAGQSGPVTVSNAQATRDWIDVSDVVEAVYLLALHAPPEPGTMGLYNIATGQETTVLELADYLCRLAGDFHAVAGERGESRTGIDRSCGDARRLRENTGWRPRYSWQHSARSLWQEAA